MSRDRLLLKRGISLNNQQRMHTHPWQLRVPLLFALSGMFDMFALLLYISSGLLILNTIRYHNICYISVTLPY